MTPQEKMNEWFATHKPQANSTLFKHLMSSEKDWDIISNYTSHIPELSNIQRIWHYYNKQRDISKCYICGSPTNFISFKKGYSKTCSKSCTSKKLWEDGKINSDIISTRVKTFKKIWGKEGGRHNELLERRRQSNIEKYGASHHMKSKEFQELAHEICLQVAAMNPRFLKEQDIPENILSEEEEILKDQIKEEKPKEILDKIIKGKIEKFKKENSLVSQTWIKDPEKDINNLITEYIGKIGENIFIEKFVRFEI